MNLIEIQRALGQLRLGGMAAVLETRLHQAQSERMAPIDLISCLISDELSRRSDRLLERRRKNAEFRDPQKTLDNFDFNFNKKLNRSLVCDLATANFIARHEDCLFLGPPGTGGHRGRRVLRALFRWFMPIANTKPSRPRRQPRLPDLQAHSKNREDCMATGAPVQPGRPFVLCA